MIARVNVKRTSDEVAMSEINHFLRGGGPAFPCELTFANGAKAYTSGMTLRDWFAGQALAGMMASEVDGSTYNEVPAAERAYRFSDAMIAEREKGGSK